jgi:hypothetical protein
MQEKLVMKFLVHVEDDDVQHKGGLHYQLVTSGMSMQTRRQCFSHPRTAMAIKFQGNDILIVPIFPEFFIFSPPMFPNSSTFPQRVCTQLFSNLQNYLHAFQQLAIDKMEKRKGF